MQDNSIASVTSGNPFVSIIILSYNGVAYLENCLDSVENQDYPRDRFEIIVADNGSTDNSVSLLKAKYRDAITLLEYGTNHGFARGNNIAVGHAKGDLLVLLNQDTVVEGKWLSGLVSGIIDAGFDVCHSNMLLPRNKEFENIYGEESPRNVYYYELNRYGYVEQVIRDHGNGIIKTRFLSGACFIIRRSVIETLGYLFDEDFGSYNEDMDLGLRLLHNGFKTGVVPSSVVYHLSSFSFSVSTYNIWKNLMIIRNRFIVFWKSSSGREFLCFLPRLIVSQSHKVFRRSVELKNGFAKSFILACSVMPLSLISFLWFIVFVLRRGGSITENGFKTASR